MEYFPPYQKTRMSQSSVIPVLQCELLSPKALTKNTEILQPAGLQALLM